MAEAGTLAAWSSELASLIEDAAKGAVQVHGRRRLPATGVVWAQNVVVTADHVLERDEEITVTGADGSTVPATIAGRDQRSDIAVLRVDAPSWAPAQLASGGSLKVGNLAVAIGRATGSTQASSGMVNAVEGARRGAAHGFIRADVEMLPGFSGGPLVGVDGAVVGINSSRLAGGSHAAIPTSGVRTIVDTLLRQGSVKRAFLGISSQQVRLPGTLSAKLGREQETGLVTLKVEPESPAERAGLLVGDIVVAVAGQPVRDAEELQASLGPERVGVATSISVLRGGEPHELSFTAAERT